jgi:hypothetical protein
MQNYSNQQNHSSIHSFSLSYLWIKKLKNPFLKYQESGITDNYLKNSTGMKMVILLVT